MAIVEFALGEDGIAALRDVLTCLSKFSDDVCLEAGKDQLVLTTLNAIKSAYASFSFPSLPFFSRYHYTDTGRARDTFSCTLQIRFLLAVFRSRTGGDGQRDRESERLTPIERCDVAIEDGHDIKSRLIAKLFFRNGLTASHQVSFESSPPVHAVFDEKEARDHWRISSKTLRESLDHVGRGVDLLDLHSDGDHVNFTSFTEKTVWDEELRKKPLHTSVAIEMDEFEAIGMQDSIHVVVAVKDFRAVVQHASLSRSSLSARFSLPGRPMRLWYETDGKIQCRFLLMTCGSRGQASQQKAKKAKAPIAPLESQLRIPAVREPVPASAQPAQQQSPSRLSGHQARPRQSNLAAPTPDSARATLSRFSHFDLRPSQRPPPTIRSEGLFVDDERWEPVRPDGEDEEDARLEWEYDTNDPPTNSHVGFGNEERPRAPMESAPETGSQLMSLAPTQPIAAVRRLGLFYDGAD